MLLEIACEMKAGEKRGRPEFDFLLSFFYYSFIYFLTHSPSHVFFKLLFLLFSWNSLALDFILSFFFTFILFIRGGEGGEGQGDTGFGYVALKLALIWDGYKVIYYISDLCSVREAIKDFLFWPRRTQIYILISLFIVGLFCLFMYPVIHFVVYIYSFIELVYSAIYYLLYLNHFAYTATHIFTLSIT